MAVSALQQKIALRDLGNTVSKQQQLWISVDALQPNSAACCVHHSRAEQQLSTHVDHISPVQARVNGLLQFETGAASSRGIIILERLAEKERQESLWQDFFLDPTKWWDNRQEKRSSRHPDFRHKMSKEALFLDNLYKPPWVDAQLALWDSQQKTGKREPPGSESTANLGLGKVDRYQCSSEAEMLRTLSEEGELTDAVEALSSLVNRRSYVVKSLFCNVIKRCIKQKDLALGRRVHDLTVKCGYESDAVLASHITRMYSLHGRLEEAKQVFVKVPAPHNYMWASIISAHAEHGQPAQAINLYRQMRESSVKPNSHVFVAALKACANAADLATGKEVHDDFLGSAVGQNDLFVGSCLVDMYAKCGSLEDARRLFDKMPTKDVVTWNGMIGGYAQQGHGDEALSLYASMQQDITTSANEVTFVCLLKACASIGSVDDGKEIHAEVRQRGLDADVVVGNCLIDMYAKCGGLEESRRVFDSLPTKDVVTWNAMIAGYAHNGLPLEALSLYSSMQQNGVVQPNHVTFVCLLQACASVGALLQGKQLHAQIQQRCLDTDVVLGSSLVDMYAKCGTVEEARKVFDTLQTKNVVTWNALLNGYALCSDAHMAKRSFAEMQQQGVKPDDATFISLLVACSHDALLHDGQMFFRMMVEDHGIAPPAHHYSCMVDLLGRSGRLDDAENMLESTLALEDDVVGWTALLSACKSHGDIERARRCFERLVAVQPETAGPYVLLGSMYANAGRWWDVNRVESLRRSAGAWKKPAKACIEVQYKVHEFTVGEERGDVSSKLRSVNVKLQDEGGHVPQTELVLQAVSDSRKEDALCGHAEKLALAYGLLNTPEGTPLLVTKNLRMCSDCHSSTKVMSRLEKRRIVVRDAHRVHCFQNGSCSCADRH